MVNATWGERERMGQNTSVSDCEIRVNGKKKCLPGWSHRQALFVHYLTGTLFAKVISSIP